VNILQVVPYFPPGHAFGGPANVAHQISRELAKRGHEVVVYTTDAKDTSSKLRVQCFEVVDGAKVHYFRNASMALVNWSKIFVTPGMISRARDEVKTFDIVHLHEYRTFQNAIVHHYAKKYDVTYVLQAHGSLPRIVTKQKLKWIYDTIFGYNLLRDASKVIALSQMEVEQYRHMDAPDEKIAVIPNGIDLSEYTDLPPRGAFRNKIGVDEEEKIILYLGRIHRIKGVDILIKAFVKIVEDSDDVKLVVAGPDDGYLSEAIALIKNLRIEGNVLIPGPLYGRNKLEAYADADVCVFPSLYEAFPVGLLEASSCGRPVIASGIGGLREMVVDGVTGLLVEPGEISQLTNAINSVLDEDSRKAKMGRRGREFVKANFTIDKVVDRLEGVYKKAVEDVSPKNSHNP
jgi:glycosyltransferase involved in cell wall biosynthesis